MLALKGRLFMWLGEWLICAQCDWIEESKKREREKKKSNFQIIFNADGMTHALEAGLVFPAELRLTMRSCRFSPGGYLKRWLCSSDAAELKVRDGSLFRRPQTISEVIWLWRKKKLWARRKTNQREGDWIVERCFLFSVHCVYASVCACAPLRSTKSFAQQGLIVWKAWP